MSECSISEVEKNTGQARLIFYMRFYLFIYCILFIVWRERQYAAGWEINYALRDSSSSCFFNSTSWQPIQVLVNMNRVEWFWQAVIFSLYVPFVGNCKPKTSCSHLIDLYNWNFDWSYSQFASCSKTFRVIRFTLAFFLLIFLALLPLTENFSKSESLHTYLDFCQIRPTIRHTHARMYQIKTE